VTIDQALRIKEVIGFMKVQDVNGDWLVLSDLVDEFVKVKKEKRGHDEG